MQGDREILGIAHAHEIDRALIGSQAVAGVRSNDNRAVYRPGRAGWVMAGDGGAGDAAQIVLESKEQLVVVGGTAWQMTGSATFNPARPNQRHIHIEGPGAAAVEL